MVFLGAVIVSGLFTRSASLTFAHFSHHVCHSHNGKKIVISNHCPFRAPEAEPEAALCARLTSRGGRPRGPCGTGLTDGACLLPQVPQDEWGGYPTGGKDEEIPCRRMRSGSYIKAMGDVDSGESDSSPKTSPTVAMRPEPLLQSMGQRPLGDLQT